MKKTLACLSLLIMCLLLSSCFNQEKPQIALSSDTPNPSITFVPTQTTISPTSTPHLSSTPTPSPKITLIPPYPTKEVLFDYTISGFHSSTDLYYSDYKWSLLVIYSDGQIIIPGKPYQQKTLSKDELNLFLSKLDSLGFYTIESNQQHDPTDTLYIFEDQYQRIYDALWYCVLINGDKPRNLCAYEPFMKFLVPEMSNTLKFLDGYRPEGMFTYLPDRVLLRVQIGRNPYDENLPNEATPWTEPSLSLKTDNEKVLYAEGEVASRLFAQLGNDSGKVFIQNDAEYTVYLEIVLPHDEITNIYEQ